MNLLLRTPSQIINPLARGRRFGFGSGVQGGAFVGPLDAYATSISRCWCPGKRLLSSWAGNAGTLRETTGSTEQTFGFTGSSQYLNTSSITSFLSGAGASAAAWKVIYDQKGSGDDLTQTTAASQPLYTSSHSGFNNRPCVYLDTAAKGMPATLDIVRPYSILVIEDDEGPNSLRTITAYTGTSTFENNLICANRGGLTFFRGGTVSTTTTAAACVEILTGPSAGNHKAWCNGVDITTGTQASGDWRKLALGRAPAGSEGAITKVFALIVFNTDLSAGDVAALQTILAPASL